MTAAQADFHFDVGQVEIAFRFLQSLTLTKSTKSGRPEPFRLLSFQRRLIGNIIGWKRSDGKRCYRKAYFSVARKNGKTELIAALALYFLVIDGEMSPEIYMAAKDRDQASLCFNAAMAFVNSNEELRSLLVVTPSRKTISNPLNNGIIKALSSEGASKHGLNPSVVIGDELHAWASSEEELYAALTTGSGARSEPLHVWITTAGYDEESICYREYEYAKGVQNGLFTDPTYYVQIHELGEADDWTSEECWPKANPALGEILNIEELRAERDRALSVPALQNNFKRLKCNQWVHQEEVFVPVEAWDACRVEDWPDLSGHVAYAGLDLSSTTDVTALVLNVAHDGRDWLMPHFWLPAAYLTDRCRRDRVPYDAWADAGLITLTPGEVIDYDVVISDVQKIIAQYDVRHVAFDRWGAEAVRQQLQRAGIELVQFGQGFASMSAPTKDFLTAVLARTICHNGNPVLRWMVSCLSVAQDAAGNVKPVKQDRRKSSKRIDGVVASIMAKAVTVQQSGGGMEFFTV